MYAAKNLPVSELAQAVFAVLALFSWESFL